MIRSISVLFAVLVTAQPAYAQVLAPYKERLFSYRSPIEIRDNGDFLRLPYDVRLDINKRDAQPVRKVKGFYVSSRPKRHEKDLAIEANGRQITHFAVGKVKGPAAMTVIFIHGRDGTRDLGFSDERFGGNFNRLKNLMFRNGGLYISTDFTDFKEEGARDIAAMVAHYRPLTSGKLVLACGSMGTFLCWRLMGASRVNTLVDGYVILGGFPDPRFLSSGQASVPVPQKPIYFAHGSIDSVYPWKDTHRFYEALRKKSPGYPVRYALFNTGKHGTPVRMIDWRAALNWIAAH